MFGRVPSEDCNHSRSGVCSKCILEQTYDLKTEPKIKIPTTPPSSSYVVTNHAETPTSTPLLDFFHIRHDSVPTAHFLPSTSSAENNKEEAAYIDRSSTSSPSTICDEQPHPLGQKTAAVKAAAAASPRRSAPIALDFAEAAESIGKGFQSIALGVDEADTTPQSFSTLKSDSEQTPTETKMLSSDEWRTRRDSAKDEEFSYTSFEALEHQTHRRITEEEELEEREGKLAENVNPVNTESRLMEKPNESLVRLFESSLFEPSHVMEYLYNSKNTAVLFYLGSRLDRYNVEEMNFFIPQLITMYINMTSVASSIHNYMIERCKNNIEFSLECYWLLEAYEVEQFKTHHKKAQGFFLRETIFNEYMRAKDLLKAERPLSMHPIPAASLHHHRSHSDARTNDQPSDATTENTLSTNNGSAMKRTASVRTFCGPTDLSSGRAFDTGCRCSPESNGSENECSCGAEDRAIPELDFVNSLIGIGNRLKDIQPRCERYKRLIYELFLLNLNLPARVWIPLYSSWCNHIVLRIPHTEGCVLNSKDKAPYCIYCEVLEVSDANTVELPERAMDVVDKAFPVGSPAPLNVSTNGLLPPTSLGLSPFGPLSPVEEMAAAVAERAITQTGLAACSSEPVLCEMLHHDELIHYDRIIDETRSVADSDEVYSQFSDEPEFHDKPASKLDKIRSRLARLKRRRRAGIAHTADDPSASAMSEPWEQKLKRIKEASPYGNLPGWRLLPVIIKTGDDLRQELLAYQLLTTLQEIWKEENVPLHVRPYKILVCSPTSGMIEPIPNACSLHQIKKNLSSKPNLDDAGQPYSSNLLSHFLINYGSRLSESFQQAQRNFIRSCAAYSLACYFLQVKDRHNGNILLDSEGYLIHIDFGYILSISPRNLGFETSPFKLTQELIDVMGGPNSEMFAHFRELLFSGMVAARKHHERILNIVRIMSDGSQLPCFRSGTNVVRLLRERFHIGCTEQQLRAVVNSLIEQSRDSITTRLYDNFQYYTNGIF